ncbi:MAG: hypothetical protein J0M20_13830, partial [Burkholderiales bacterium]|nr:hypothetical protein [Burkholderiales bacterium]
MPDLDDLRAWRQLSHASGVGRASLRRLLTVCGSPQAALDAPQALWQEHAGASAAQGLAARHDSDAAADAAWGATARWLDGNAQR